MWYNVFMNFNTFERNLNEEFDEIFEAIDENSGIIVPILIAIGLVILIVYVGTQRNNSGNHIHINEDYEKKLKDIADEKEKQRLIREGGWECYKCHMMNPKHQTSCLCGESKMKSEIMIEKQTENRLKEDLLKLKEMRDEGVITQEEYELKKKQLLQI